MSRMAAQRVSFTPFSVRRSFLKGVKGLFFPRRLLLLGLVVVEPAVNQLIAPGNKHTPGLQYGIMIFGPSLLVTNRDLGQRFIKCLP